MNTTANPPANNNPAAWDGYYVSYSATGSSPSYYTQTCLNCHNPTGFVPAGTASTPPADTNPADHEYGILNLAGVWASDDLNGNYASGNPLGGVQCEHCHNSGSDGMGSFETAPGGPYDSMAIPVHSGSPAGGQICVNCHSTNGINAAAGTQFQIPYVANTPPASIPGGSGVVGVAGYFNNHHPEGDEYRTSPHQNLGCTACHDPHSSVWHNDGGVLYSYPAINPTTGSVYPESQTQGTMCLACHSQAITAQNAPVTGQAIPAIRIRGPMGDIGLECADCHMPLISGASRGSRTSSRSTTPISPQRKILIKLREAPRRTGTEMRRIQVRPTGHRSRWTSYAPTATTT